MGTTTLTLKPYLETPTAQLISQSTDYIPKWRVFLGDNAPPGTIVEGQYTLSTDTGFNNILGTQVATADEGSLLDGQHDFINEPSLPNGNYIFRFRSRYRGMEPPAWSASYPVTINANYGLDMTPPVLSLPSGTTVSDNSATFKVTTNKTGGKIYVAYRSSSPTALTDDEIIAINRSFDVTVAGEQTYTITGLSKGSPYYPMFVHVSQTGVKSLVAVGEQFVTTDSTPPSIASGVVTPTSATTADFTFQTDQPNGTASVVATTSSTQPSIAQIEAGQDHTGAAVAAGRFKSKAVGAAGTISFLGSASQGFTGLTGGATLYWHAVHRDELGQASNRLTVSKTMPAAVDTTAPTIVSVGSAFQSTTTGVSQMQTNEGNGNARMMLTTTNSQPSIATIEGTAAIPVTAPGIISQNWTGLTPGQIYYAWGFHRDQAGNPSAVISLGSFTPQASALKALTVTPVHMPDATKPQFMVRGSLAQVGDEFRLSWDLPTPGYVDAVMQLSNLTNSWQAAWLGVPNFPKNIDITFTVRQKRGADTVQKSVVVRFLDTPNVVTPPAEPPPPVVDTNSYLLRKDGTSKYLRKDGVSFLLRQ